MRLVARWGVAVVVSTAGFALAWWVCQEGIRLNEGISLGIAGAVLAMLLAFAAWWAPRGADSAGSEGSGKRLTQKARASRDAYMAGRDMMINQRREDK
jgi:high-affinity Fe2+/Pb2+ permease